MIRRHDRDGESRRLRWESIDCRLERSVTISLTVHYHARVVFVSLNRPLYVALTFSAGKPIVSCQRPMVRLSCSLLSEYPKNFTCLTLWMIRGLSASPSSSAMRGLHRSMLGFEPFSDRSSAPRSHFSYAKSADQCLNAG